jgi:flagellum-specific peptidoglycan hydrolase FlgJ
MIFRPPKKRKNEKMRIRLSAQTIENTLGEMSSKKGSAPAKKDDKAAVAAPAADAPKPPKRKAQRGGVIAVEKPPQQVGSAVVAMWQRTPIQLLNEYCQREKRPKPIFNEASCREAGKCRASVALPDTKNKTKDLFFVSDQCWDEITDARNYTCLLALQHLGDSLPLERKLPDPFREAWLSLKSAAPAVTTNRKFACADDQAKYEEQQRLASLSKEKQEESKYSKVRMSDSQREFVQDIIRSVQTSSQPTQSSAWLDDDSEQADEENTLNPTGEPAIDMLIDELNKLGFDSNDLQPAIEFADQSDWRQKEQDRQKAEQEKATTAASKPKPKLKGMPERPKSAAPVQPVLPPALLDAALEWLCVHLPEDKLPAQFDPRRKQIKLVNTKTTKDADKTKEATPKEVAPVVTVAPTAFTIAKSIDDVWSSLPLIGLPQEPCDSILSQVQSQMKAGTVTAAVKTTAVLVIFRALYAHWRNAAAPTPLNLHVKSLNEDQCRLNIETQSEEFEMLQSIYGDSDCQREEALSLWRIKLEDTAKTNNAKNCWVEFLVPDQCAYPNELPVILIKYVITSRTFLFKHSFIFTDDNVNFSLMIL